MSTMFPSLISCARLGIWLRFRLSLMCSRKAPSHEMRMALRCRGGVEALNAVALAKMSKPKRKRLQPDIVATF